MELNWTKRERVNAKSMSEKSVKNRRESIGMIEAQLMRVSLIR